MNEAYITKLKEANAAKIAKAKVVLACSDGTIYFEPNVEAIEEHAKEHKLSLAYIKPEGETKNFSKKKS